MSERENRLQPKRETPSELTDREGQRDFKIRGWLGCLPVLAVGGLSVFPRPPHRSPSVGGGTDRPARNGVGTRW